MSKLRFSIGSSSVGGFRHISQVLDRVPSDRPADIRNPVFFDGMLDADFDGIVDPVAALGDPRFGLMDADHG